MSLTKYDLLLLRINTDHRRVVSEYDLALLGKDGPKYFKVESTKSQQVDFNEIMRAAMAQYEEDEDE